MNAQLPEAASARVKRRKIEDYLLARDHPVGGAKAGFFLGRGFTREDWEGMADALRQHARVNPVRRRKETKFATNYSVDCHLPTPDGSSLCIRTVWEVRPEDPRLITAHPLG